ncbi:4-amino-4-deoxy-L-arabinose transferase-like glycosyltransferase [Janthinobacterium sp. CG_23.3]|uniref:glycosyltransferase family 39 protein n=1 Tax=Janthinobacterium sp. CG_23.3 TaxID=3349634 RepID=UPI0038D48810
MNQLHKSKPLLWCLLLAFTAITLYMLGVRTLVPPDEGRYAEMAREMFVSGDWITTRLNGIKYFEKPPLQTWMNALTFAAFGVGEWQARLWTGLCGLLGVALTAHAGAKLFGARVGLYAALVLASSLFWSAAGQIDSLDMGLAAMMTLSLAGLLLAQRDGAGAAGRRNWMLACWAGMALAVLSKGLIGLVLPGAVLVLYTLAARDWAIWGRLHLAKGALLFFAIAAPWFVLVALNNPEQPHFFFIHEHVERFLLKTHHREGAWYYFVPLLLVGVMPWLTLLPHSLAAALRRAPGAFQPKLLLLVWAAFIVVFFSCSSSKLPGYIVPVFPALALLIALQLETASRRGHMLCAALVALLGAAALVAVPLAIQGSQRPPAELLPLKAYEPWLLAAAFVLLAGGALALLRARQARRDVTVLTLACAGFLATHLILAGFEPYGRLRAGVALLPQIRAELGPATTIYSVGTYEQALTFYLGRTVTLVDYSDEFEFGLRQQPALARDVDAFVAQWRADAQAGVRDLAILRPDYYAKLRLRGVPMRVVAQDSRRMVVANR